MDNKYTVIIPTRDRVETLEATLRTCLRQTYKNFEIIVSDNCSSDSTREMVSRFNDARLRYINPGYRLSMAGNFEFALSHVTSGFVMFIGADDGIMPDAIDSVDYIVRKYGVEAVSCRQATYVWPDFQDESIAGRFVFSEERSDTEVRATELWLKRSLDFEDIYIFELPNLYCGFVHKNIINKALKDGKYFRSVTPDAYSSYATSIFLDRYAYTYKPFVIAGASNKSNGASQMHSKADGVEANKFESENDIPYANGFVKCPSYQVIAGEAFAKLAEVFPEKCSKYHINYKRMLQRALSSSNDRTQQEVRMAVTQMASNFSIPLNELNELNCSNQKRTSFFRKVIQAIFKLRMPIRVVAISNSQKTAIRDIDDAALAAYVLSQQYSNTSYIMSRPYLMARIKKIFKKNIA